MRMDDIISSCGSVFLLSIINGINGATTLPLKQHSLCSKAKLFYFPPSAVAAETGGSQITRKSEASAMAECRGTLGRAMRKGNHDTLKLMSPS